MHLSSLLRMEWFVNNHLDKLPPPPRKTISVLDVGSYDVNGSYKTFFTDVTKYSYIGLDMESGPNVDVVAETPYYWSMFEDESFDVVISGQAFEHIEFFWLTLAEMIRVLKRGGLMCIIAPCKFKRHAYPIDCYRFDVDGMIALARYGNLLPRHATENLAPPNAPLGWYPPGYTDSMLIAEKPIEWSGLVNHREYKFSPVNYEDLKSGFVTGEEHEFPKEEYYKLKSRFMS